MEGEKRVFIIYHRTDYDGIFSGNIARKFYDNNDYWIRLQGFNYGDELPDIDKIIQRMKNRPNGIRFNELSKVLEYYGYTMKKRQEHLIEIL